MNQYSQLLYFLKQLAEEHPFVNTVTKGLAANIDLEKANIFPLVHITIDEASFVNGQTLRFNVTLECLSERNLNKKVVTDKFWRQDNEVDNHNETLAVLNFMWTSIFRDWNENNMTTSDEPTLNKIEFEKGNILDGWSMSFQVEVPNTALTLCEVTFEDIEAVVSSGTGGTVKPSEGTFALTYGANNVYYAEPETGYRFVQWLYNGLSKLLNPIAIKAVENYTLIASFIRQWQLTTSVVGDGTITPSSGLYDDGTIITVTAEPLNPETTELDRVEVNSEVVSTTSPFNYVINGVSEMVAYFSSLTWNLTISNNGNGITNPVTGSYDLPRNSVQTITSTANSGYAFFYYNIDGNLVYENTYNLLLNSDKNVVSNFIQTTGNEQYPNADKLAPTILLSPLKLW